MSGWEIFWIIVLVLIVIGILVNMKDIARYMKIRNM